MEHRALYPHQTKAFRSIRGKKCAALYMEMRLGKTLVAIRYLKFHKCSLVLIVAPNSALPSWEEELNAEGITWTRLIGDQKNRVRMLETLYGECFVLTNKESHISIGDRLTQFEWDAVVLDESTFIKNPKARVTKYYLKHFTKVPRRLLLTGTPSPEGDLDLVTQLLFLANRVGSCSNYWSFRNRYCFPVGFDWVIGAEGQKQIHRGLEQYSFRLTRKDAGFKIQKVFEKRLLSLPSKLQNAYDTLEEELVYEYDGKELSLKHTAAQYVRLRQLASGLDYEKEIVWDGKIQEVYNLINGELSHEPVVVWFLDNDLLYACYNHLLNKQVGVAHITGKHSTTTREQMRRKFQNGDNDCRVLLIQVKCADMGMKLDRCDTMIYAQEPSGGLSFIQTADRMLSLGKNRTLLYLYLLTDNTVDINMHYHLVHKKYRSTKMLIEAVYQNIKERVDAKKNS